MVNLVEEYVWFDTDFFGKISFFVLRLNWCKRDTLHYSRWQHLKKPTGKLEVWIELHVSPTTFLLCILHFLCYFSLPKNLTKTNQTNTFQIKFSTKTTTHTKSISVGLSQAAGSISMTDERAPVEDHLDTLDPSLERTFRGHKSVVTSVDFRPDLKQIASGSSDCR